MQSVFDSYRGLCRIRKSQNIDYSVFEKKYYQCYHGNQDLTTERSPDDSSPLTFLDLPMDVLEKVVENLNIAECMVLRKVSHGLRILVDTYKTHYEKIALHFDDRQFKIDCDNVRLTYDQFDGVCRVSCFDRCSLKCKEYKDNRNSKKVMMGDAATILNNPNLVIGSLSINTNRRALGTIFFKFLESLNCQLDVRSIPIHTAEQLSVLHCLKPKRLVEIDLGSVYLTIDKLNKIAKTEQWKQARKLSWYPFHFLDFRIENNMLHFEKIKMLKFNVDRHNIFWVRDLLLNSTHLKSCSLEFMNIDSEDAVDGLLCQDPAYDVETRRFSLPNSRDYFQLEFRRDEKGFVAGLCIEKKSEN